MPEQFQCPESDCGFVERTEKYDEAIEAGRQHLEQEHDEDVDESAVEEHVGTVSNP